jgi:hypothetical protein
VGRLTKEAKLELEYQVWDLAANHYMNERQIGRKLGLQPRRVREILESVASRYQEDMRINAAKYASQQLTRYEWIAAEAKEAYLRSAVNQVTAVKKTEQIYDTDGNPIGMKVKTDERVKINNVGNPTYLDVMLRALDAETKIVAGERPQLDHMDQRPVSLTDEDRKRMLTAMMQRMRLVEEVQAKQLQDSQAVEAEYEVSHEQ